MSGAMGKRVAKLETVIVPARSCGVCRGGNHCVVFTHAGPDDYRPALDGGRPPMPVCAGCGRHSKKTYILGDRAHWERHREWWE